MLHRWLTLREQLILLFFGVSLLIGGLGALFWNDGEEEAPGTVTVLTNQDTPSTPVLEAEAPSLSGLSGAPESANQQNPAPMPAPAEVAISLTGAVEVPGVYRFVEGTRVTDALEKAGGASLEADLSNVRADIPAWRSLIAASWDITITPLDGCGDMILRGERFAKVTASDHPLARIVIENYDLWTNRHHHAKDTSSVLFDTVAVYLAQAEDYCIVKTEKLAVDDKGKTIIDPQGKDVHCHLGWKDRKAFEDSLVRALTESPNR